ncbi:MAG: nucleotidyltransferase domain-containing protein [Thermodesulfobacteriota bacterium]|nr:nucleotidyltransferase domain-containing protein [Thermodesulfobacteriota bacterium]
MLDRKEKLYQIADKFSLDIIYAFGSRATEAAEYIRNEGSEIYPSAFSDVDIGVQPSTKKKFSIKDKVNLSLALEEFFSVGRVDLVIILEADPFLAANIIRGERIYCRDEYKADEYDLYILRRAGDLVPLERERIALIMGKNG